MGVLPMFLIGFSLFVVLFFWDCLHCGFLVSFVSLFNLLGLFFGCFAYDSLWSSLFVVLFFFFCGFLGFFLLLLIF